jgi:hypothetical protein
MNKKQTSIAMALMAVAAAMFTFVAVVATPVQGMREDDQPDGCGWSDCSPDVVITSSVYYNL